MSKSRIDHHVSRSRWLLHYYMCRSELVNSSRVCTVEFQMYSSESSHTTYHLPHTTHHFTHQFVLLTIKPGAHCRAVATHKYLAHTSVGHMSPSSTVSAEEPSGDRETSPDTHDFVHQARPKIPDLCLLYPGQCVPGYHYHNFDGRLKA